jgi:hypothetical protein
LLPRRLQFVGDAHAHIAWCGLLARQESHFHDPVFGPVVDILTPTASELLLASKRDSWDVHVKLCSFLIRTSASVIVRFIENLNPTERDSFLDEAPAVLSLLQESRPELLEGYGHGAPSLVLEPFYPVLPELPKDEAEIQSAFDCFSCLANLEMTKEVLKIAVNCHFQVKISIFALPKQVIGPIAEFMAESQPNTFDPIRALTLARTAWRPLCLARLRSNTDDVLLMLIADDEVTKDAILGLCSIIGFIPLDLVLLFQLAMKLFYLSETTDRFCSTSTFLGTVLGVMDSLTSSLIEPFFKKVDESFEVMFLPLLPRLFAVVANAISTTPAFWAMVQGTMPSSGNKTVPAGRLHQALFAGRHPMNPAHVSDTIIPFLQSVMPSLYMTGLRLVEQAAVSLSSDRLVVGLRAPLEVLADRFIRMAAVPNIADLQRHVIVSILTKVTSNAVQTNLFKLMPQKFALSPESPGYADGFQFWPLVIRAITPDADWFRRILRFCDQLLLSPLGFEVGLRCLKEKLSKAEKGRREAVFMESLRPWAAALKTGQDYGTSRRITGWFLFVIDFDLRMVHVLATELLMVASSEQFVLVFAAMARIVVKYRDNPAVVAAIGNAAALLDMNCRREAVALLGKCTDWNALVRLASFSQDCEESEGLAQLLMSQVL